MPHVKPLLTFIIPVRHPANAKDWGALKRNLAETVRSVAAQDCDQWNAVIVANEGADLPTLPRGVDVKWVDFPPNPMNERGNADKETFYNAIRLDKGRRILAGMLHAGTTGHIMVLDDDDFVSNKLASFVARNPQANGWYFRNGYVWAQGKLLYLNKYFHTLCGSSHMIKAELYGLPSQLSDASDEYIRQKMGSHVYIYSYLESIGKPLSPLPFPGAIYRVGHAGSISRSSALLGQYFSIQSTARHPLRALVRLTRLRWLTSAIREEFFG